MVAPTPWVAKAGHPGRASLVMGALYAGTATLLLWFLFWALLDTYDYTLHALLLGSFAFLGWIGISQYARHHGEHQRRDAETLRTPYGDEPTSETRWENRY